MAAHKADKELVTAAAIDDPTAKKVFEVLSSPRPAFRTAEEIARDTNLSKGEVEAILTSHPDLVRTAAVPSPDGDVLFTLRSKPVTARERLALWRTLLAKSIR